MRTTQNTPSAQDAKVEEYDLLILGGGTGGTVAAWTFAIKENALQ
jgi:cysteine synthase